MKKFFDTAIWVSLFILFVPTTLIIGSWNSLPGNFMYPVKLALERTLLVVASPSYLASSQLQVKYTERRFSETQTLLSEKHSVEGLPYLARQVETTKVAIEKAPDPQTQQVLTRQYIATLTQVSYGLEQQKQVITVGAGQRGGGTPPAVSQGMLGGASPKPSPITSVTAVQNPPDITPQPSPKLTPLAARPTPLPSVTATVTTQATVSPETAVVALQIAQTQEKIQETIAELEKKQKERERKTDSLRKKIKKTEKELAKKIKLTKRPFEL